QAPVLRLRERAGLDDPDDVADLRLVLLVVSVELGRAPDDLLVLGVRLHRVDPDNDRLVHAARDDDTAPLLAPAARMLRLGQARDRLALGRALALRLRVAVALGTRQALPLALRRCLGRSFAYGLGFGRLGLLGLFDRLVLCLLVLVLVSHSQLDSRSLLVRSGRSGCGRSHASRA